MVFRDEGAKRAGRLLQFSGNAQDAPDWLEPLFPWRRQAIVVIGRRMACIDEGPRGGRPVLLLSGNPTWGFFYRDFIEPLTAAGYRAIAPDWVGAGYSDHPPHDASLTFVHHVADLGTLTANTMQLSPPYLPSACTPNLPRSGSAAFISSPSNPLCSHYTT